MSLGGGAHYLGKSSHFSGMERRSFQLTLVRHGETEENRLGIIQGQADVPLNDTGRQQARLAAEKLACETFTSVYSSDLIRVKETADTIVSRLPEKMDIVTDRRLREKCFGVMEGVSYSDLIAEGKLAGVKSILHYTPPGAETIDEFASRAMDFFCEICNQSCSGPSLSVPSKSILSQYLANKDGTTISSKSMPSRHVLVATHGGIIISLISMFLQRCRCTSTYSIRPCSNCSIYSLIVVLKASSLPITPDSLEPSVCTVTPLCMYHTDHLEKAQSTL